MPPVATSRNASRVRIRPARPDERQALEDLQRRASLALPDYREQLLAYPDAIHLPSEQVDRGDVWVVESDAGIDGFAALNASDESIELDGLFVEPEKWRQGIGSALVETAIHEARRRGFSLSVTTEPSARLFYEKCGFVYESDAETRFGPAVRMSR